jgi:signal transduction histidine kinase
VTLSGRLWLYGAAFPVLVLAAVLAVADGLYHYSLETSLDRALLAQAAVESVSLFDGPRNQPHLHMATSPLVDSVRPFAPQGVLFGPDGRQVMRYPPEPGEADEPLLLPRTPGAPPEVSTRERGGHPVRELTVSVASPDGAPYTLRLSASLAQLEASMLQFHLVAVGTVLVAALLLVAVQAWQGRRLRSRLHVLQAHLEAVRAQDLEQVLPEEAERDELSALREVLGAATLALRQTRAARERLLADAAHELRTPLTLMRTSLDLALRKERSSEELKAALRDTREEVVRLAALASRLLEAAAVEQAPLQRELVDLVPLLQPAVEAARPSAQERGVTLELDAPATLPARVHGASVRQALDNLLSNALKVAPHGSRVQVTLRALGGGARLSVSDEGPGIPPGEQEAVFEPFHRAPGAAPGTGLGLTIVRDIARKHGGRAWVEPTARGATVMFELAGDR